MLPCQPLSIFQKSALKMERSAMVGHINTISKQATTCTLITNLGEKKEVGGLNFFSSSTRIAFSNDSRCKPYFWPPSALIWRLCFPRYYLRSLKKIQVQLILTKPFWTWLSSPRLATLPASPCPAPPQSSPPSSSACLMDLPLGRRSSS